MGGIAGGTVGTHVHSQNVKQYNSLAEELQLKDDIIGWNKEGLSEKDIAARVEEHRGQVLARRQSLLRGGGQDLAQERIAGSSA